MANPATRASILRLRSAIEAAEAEVPGLMNVLISEVVDSVEVSLVQEAGIGTGRVEKLTWGR